MDFSAVIIIVLLFVIILLLCRKDKPVKQSNNTVASQPPTTPMWDGPEPTTEQKQENWQWLVEFFKRYPNDKLKETYPQLHQIATASKRYDELEDLRRSGRIDEIDYNLELEKILPLISTDDLK